MSIRFIRIDDRLIHGQVVTAWIKNHQAKNVLIIDDLVAQDAFLKNVLEMVKPSGINLIIRGTEELGQTIKTYDESAQNTVILMKTPKTAKLLYENGITLKELNVGGMGASKERHSVYKNVSASDSEMLTLKEIESLGVRVYFQATPNDKQIDLNTIK